MNTMHRACSLLTVAMAIVATSHDPSSPTQRMFWGMA